MRGEMLEDSAAALGPGAAAALGPGAWDFVMRDAMLED